MRLGSFVCDLLISIIYLMDFLCLQRNLQGRPCREILYIRCMHAYNACAVLRLLYVNPLENPPPPPPLTRYRQYYFYFLLQVVFKDTLYFLLKYVLPPVLFTPTQVVLCNV